MQSTTLTYKNVDRNILKAIPNPSKQGYEIKIRVPEFTCLGEKEQPDFAEIWTSFYPKDKIIELKSLKHYVFQFRDIRISYERVINVIYEDMMAVYDHERLRLVMTFNARGGISSKLTIDSDWKIRGGQEKFNDWQLIEDEWVSPRR